VDINDNDLDVKIAEYTKDHPRRGQRDVTSRLEQDNIHVTRQRIRDAMHRVDPEGCEQRRLNSLHRRTYSVPGPHYLWHCDGNHKLKPFKLVVLGFMDGFSRNVTGLRCSNSNSAATVLQLFTESIAKYGYPRQIRCDHGGENYDMARLMFALHDYDLNAVITGSSNHNQRIERFWRDVFEKEIEYYRDMFEMLHDYGYDFT